MLLMLCVALCTQGLETPGNEKASRVDVYRRLVEFTRLRDAEKIHITNMVVLKLIANADLVEEVMDKRYTIQDGLEITVRDILESLKGAIAQYEEENLEFKPLVEELGHALRGVKDVGESRALLSRKLMSFVLSLRDNFGKSFGRLCRGDSTLSICNRRIAHNFRDYVMGVRLPDNEVVSASRYAMAVLFFFITELDDILPLGPRPIPIWESFRPDLSLE